MTSHDLGTHAQTLDPGSLRALLYPVEHILTSLCGVTSSLQADIPVHSPTSSLAKHLLTFYWPFLMNEKERNYLLLFLGAETKVNVYLTSHVRGRLWMICILMITGMAALVYLHPYSHPYTSCVSLAAETNSLPLYILLWLIGIFSKLFNIHPAIHNW